MQQSQADRQVLRQTGGGRQVGTDGLTDSQVEDRQVLSQRTDGQR